MRTNRIVLALGAALLVAEAPAQTFYEKDGISLHGSVHLVTRNAATCQVLESNETPVSYVEKKANHGLPLHVWRMDFAARNGSKRKLERLTALFKIASEWPPCTNWIGPEDRHAKRVQWADSFEVLQRPNGIEPGGEASDSVFVLAFHDQQPEFEDWQLDYRFVSESESAPPVSGSVTGNRSSDSGGRTRLTPAKLPPDIEADRYLLQAEQAVRDGDPAGARAAMLRLQSLQTEHGLEPPPEHHFRHAQAWEAAGERERAVESAVRYLQLQGRNAEHYTATLELINRAESGRAGSAAAGRTSGPETEISEPGPSTPPEPICSGQADGPPCWMELESHPGCYVWNPELPETESMTWTDGCVHDRADGLGTLKWIWVSSSQERQSVDGTGLLRGGKQTGDWTVLNRPYAKQEERPYVDGVIDGLVTGRFYDELRSGVTFKTPWANGEIHGIEEVYWPDGSIMHRIPYVNGRRDGIAESYGQDGSPSMKTPFVNGKVHGVEENYLDGFLWKKTPYVNGEIHGVEEEYRRDGSLESKIPWVNSNQHGMKEYYFNDGSLMGQTPYANDRPHGLSVWYHENGQLSSKTPWVEGEIQGVKEDYREDGSLLRKRPYVNGEIHGVDEWYSPDGFVTDSTRWVRGERLE